MSDNMMMGMSQTPPKDGVDKRINTFDQMETGSKSSMVASGKDDMRNTGSAEAPVHVSPSGLLNVSASAKASS